MKYKYLLLILPAFLLIFGGNVALADSCQCTDRSTAVAGACEKKNETDCYAQLNSKTACNFFTDDACKNIKDNVANGLAWTAPECKSAKGDWLPENGATVGPYCYEPQNFAEPYTLAVDILGINKAGGITNLGQYINLIYKLIVGLAIFFSIIMTTVAGFTWLTAGGNTGKIGEAKKKILNALVGLLLAAGAYTILQTINPRLLELHLPRIVKIKNLNYIGITGCEGYKTQGDCEKNPIGFNSGIAVYAPIGNSGTGCAWDAPSQACVQKPAPTPGNEGGLCLANEQCNGALKCVFTANIHVCTDGNANSVCGSNSDCNTEQGLICSPLLTKSYASICYKPGDNQPQGTPCTDSQQCASKICGSDQQCKASTQCDDTHPCPAGKECLLAGTGNSLYRECKNAQKCSHSSDCLNTIGPDSFCPAEFINDSDTNSPTLAYLKKTYPIENLPTGGVITKCYKNFTYPSGHDCAYDLECQSKNCVSPAQPGPTPKCQ